MMKIEPIKQPRIFHCFKCSTPIYQWDASGFKNHDPSGKQPFFDGDSLPLFDTGTDDGRDNTFDGEVSVGKCYKCKQHFYEFTVTVVSAKIDDEFKDAYLWNNELAPEAIANLKNGLQTRNVKLTKLDSQTPHVLVTHVLGPFDFPNPESVMSSVGVSICTSVACDNPFEHGMSWIRQHQTELIDFAYALQTQAILDSLDWVNWISPSESA